MDQIRQVLPILNL